jgi:hypothetical protein
MLFVPELDKKIEQYTKLRFFGFVIFILNGAFSIYDFLVGGFGWGLFQTTITLWCLWHLYKTEKRITEMKALREEVIQFNKAYGRES